MARSLGWLAVALVCGCATPYQGGVFQKDDTRYFIGSGPQGWSRQDFNENDLAFVSPDDHHTLAVNATCHRYGDAPLEVLLRHLLMGFTDVTSLGVVHAAMDGRDSVRGHYLARMDGVPVEMGLAVLKKDGCIYDFTYLSPPGRYAEAEPAFDKMLADFKTEAR